MISPAQEQIIGTEAYSNSCVTRLSMPQTFSLLVLKMGLRGTSSEAPLVGRSCFRTSATAASDGTADEIGHSSSQAIRERPIDGSQLTKRRLFQLRSSGTEIFQTFVEQTDR